MSYNLLKTSVVYERNKKLKPLKLSNGLYKIETIPVGAFVKDNAKTGSDHERIAFEVDDNLLHHWKETLKAMQFNGIEVPMPLNHTEDPEARRATVVDFEIGKNENGENSLYTIFKPKNEKVIEDLKDTSVSVYVPPKFVDGKGNEYIYPIKHVCFTDYPVIPGMKKMQPVSDYSGLPEGAIAASYVETKSKSKEKNVAKEMKKDPDEGKDFERGEEVEKEKIEGEEGNEDEGMGEGEDGGNESCEVTVDSVRQIAEKLGLEGIPDDKLIPAINHVIDAILESVQEGGEGEEGNQGKEKGVGPVAHRIKHEEEHYHPPGAGNNPPIAAGFISMGRKSRLGEINAAARDGFITPAISSDLIRDFCSDEALQLAFSPEGDILDNFESTMNLIRKNGKVVNLNAEKSQNDALALSYSEAFNNENSNPLIRDAARRAKEAR